MDTHGKHLLIEYMGCPFEALNNVLQIQALMKQAAVAARTNIVFSKFQPFDPQGVSGVVVIEESHLSIHTWPEHGYAAVDFYTCGEGDPHQAHHVLRSGLQATVSELVYVERGRGLEGGPCMGIRKHTRDLATPASSLRPAASRVVERVLG